MTMNSIGVTFEGNLPGNQKASSQESFEDRF